MIICDGRDGATRNRSPRAKMYKLIWIERSRHWLQLTANVQPITTMPTDGSFTTDVPPAELRSSFGRRSTLFVRPH